MNLEELSTLDIITLINKEDKKVAFAVEKELGNIAAAVDILTEALNRGGRLIYLGSGTSGKLAVIDASECPPTFGVEDSLVQGILSGGKDAFSGWLEHTEDDENLAITDLERINLNKEDVLVGVSASGNTPYVVSGIKHAKEIGCKTVGVICSADGFLKEICDLVIAVQVGDEVLLGSTRMKAGTAQKMVLNMLSTTTMMRLGNTYNNLMVNVKPINKKLKNRVKNILKTSTGATEEAALSILEKCNYDLKLAIVHIETGCSLEKAKAALERTSGKIIEAKKVIYKEEL